MTKLQLFAAIALVTSAAGCPPPNVDRPQPDAASGGTPAPTPVPAPTPTSEPAPTSTATTKPAPDASARWHGSWASASCGPRTYERWLTIAADGSVRGSERVSPCPANVACVWSGIIDWNGRWKADGDTLTVTLDSGPKQTAKLPKTVALPTSLTWDANSMAPSEKSGAENCSYSKRTNPNETKAK